MRPIERSRCHASESERQHLHASSRDGQVDRKGVAPEVLESQLCLDTLVNILRSVQTDGVLVDLYSRGGPRVGQQINNRRSVLGFNKLVSFDVSAFNAYFGLDQWTVLS